MQENKLTNILKRLIPLDRKIIFLYILLLPVLKHALKAAYLAATLFLATAIYIQQPANPLRVIIALGSAAAISVTLISTLLLLVRVYESQHITRRPLG